MSGPKCEKISRSKNFPPCLLTSVLSVLLLYAYVIASKMWIFLFVLTTFISKHSWPLPHIYELTNSLFHAKHLVGLELVLDAFLPPYFYQIMRNCSNLGSSIQLTATTAPYKYFPYYIGHNVIAYAQYCWGLVWSEKSCWVWVVCGGSVEGRDGYEG